MVRNIKVLIVLLVSTLQVPCLADVAYVERGNPAPFTGFLFSPDQEKQLRLTDQKLEFCTEKTNLLKESLETQNEVIKFSNQRVELYKTQSDNLAKQVTEIKDDSFWKNSLYFLVGATLTGLVAYGYSRATR